MGVSREPSDVRHQDNDLGQLPPQQSISFLRLIRDLAGHRGGEVAAQASLESAAVELQVDRGFSAAHHADRQDPHGQADEAQRDAPLAHQQDSTCHEPCRNRPCDAKASQRARPTLTQEPQRNHRRPGEQRPGGRAGLEPEGPSLEAVADFGGMNLHAGHAFRPGKRRVMEVLKNGRRRTNEHQSIVQLPGGFQVLVAAGLQDVPNRDRLNRARWSVRIQQGCPALGGCDLCVWTAAFLKQSRTQAWGHLGPQGLTELLGVVIRA